jgi:DNA-binding HxlR family transcriptional regulator
MADPNGQHARLYHCVLNTNAWRVLPPSAVKLYVDLRYRLTSYNNGNIEAVFTELKHRGWKSKTTLHKALRELEALGFIEKTRQGGIASMSKTCSLYRFTDLETLTQAAQGVPACKATHDYKRFETMSEASAALREACRNPAEETGGSKVHKLDVTSPKSGLKAAA